MADDKKINSIFKLMEILVEEKEIKANDKEIAKRLGYTTRTLSRHLQDLATMDSNVIKVKKGKNSVYELFDTSYVFEKVMKNTNDFSWFFDLVDRWDDAIFKDMNYEISKKERDVFLYKNSPFEELQSQEQKDIFRTLKEAIIEKKYLDIGYIYDKPRTHKKAIPLKLIFMEQNWYLAIIDQDEGFRFLRLFFVTKLGKSSKNSYIHDISKKELKACHHFLNNFQNPMSRYNNPIQTAHILTSPRVAKYFKPHMKQHFLSEKFIKKHSDGSIEFSVEYSQPIEILPFIKKWLPDLKILSPQSLVDELRDDLEAFLLN
jgi:predicted DNA-binding transcriptional regulator YafY